VIRPSAWSVWLPDRTASTEPDLGGLQGDPIGRSFDSAQLSGSPLFREGPWLPTGLVTASAESYAIVDSIEDVDEAAMPDRDNPQDRQPVVAQAATLRSEGLPVIRRWKFLVVGATSEDESRELADQIRREAPADARVRAEPPPSTCRS
jgi:hypothetical protein